MHRKLRPVNLPKARDILLAKQGHTCPLCGGSMLGPKAKNPVLDHDHETGFLRDVLCRNCNGIEGKVFNLARRAKHTLTPAEWLANLSAYWARHSTPQHGGIIHPLHKTPAEKASAARVKAREKRKKLKE